VVVEENRARTRGVERILLPNTFIVFDPCGEKQTVVAVSTRGNILGCDGGL
jgi:hypothetical protein